MRIVSAKSLCVLFGLLVFCQGATPIAEAGCFPWLFHPMYGGGWGGGYGCGYGYGMPYGGESGCGTCCPTPTYSAPVYSPPATPAPVAPVDGTYNAHYGPSLSYYGYGSSYVVDSGSCCTPCSACPTGDGANSIQSSKPGPQPTPADKTVPVTPKNNVLPPVDQFGPSDTGAGGTGNTGVGVPTGDEALPETERRPFRRPADGSVEPMEPPAEAVPPEEEAPPAGILMQVVPADHNIAVRYVPTPQRSVVVIPQSTARVVRIDRATREQLTRVEPKPQLASNP
jgi:hypothetical protein